MKLYEACCTAAVLLRRKNIESKPPTKAVLLDEIGRGYKKEMYATTVAAGT
jgi:hypothetical protein